MTDTHKITTVACPTCRKAVRWLPENRYRPFCSARCKLIDLGAWADENYKVAAQEDTPSPAEFN